MPLKLPPPVKPLPPSAAPVHSIELSQSVGAASFHFEGVLPIETVRAMVADWAKLLPSTGGLTDAQLATLLARSRRTADRAVAVAAALKSLDAETP